MTGERWGSSSRSGLIVGYERGSRRAAGWDAVRHQRRQSAPGDWDTPAHGSLLAVAPQGDHHERADELFRFEHRRRNLKEALLSLAHETDGAP